ncbi:cupin domain-containing protein [Larkinella terrae]|uniref:Cupin domain-containing protein n=1 Tax=Larkinella terrae TaxID=2025311 RepID=A0A7K0ERX2_9BACT|nr:cupin domain-containing protein [Larkinella terrae]MRS64557.1 cupin domain-containing protein [Larkinella terrae]
MAYANKVISNTKTGQEIRFIQTKNDTDGELLEMEAAFRAHSSEPVAHYHPHQTEDFQVLSGKLTVRMNGKVRLFRAGDRFHIPKNTVHAMWNPTDQKTVVNWRVTPALDTEYFLETTTGLANDGKTNASGIPSVLQLSLLINRFSRVFRLTKPGPVVQKVVFSLLTPVACVLGYKATYAKYLD